MTEITAGVTFLKITLARHQGGRLRSPVVMRKASSALSCEVSGGDHETRNLVLWLCFSAAAVAVVCCVGALALLSGPSAPRYSAAAIPPLGSAAPLSAPAPNSSAEQPPPAALVAPAPSIIQEQATESRASRLRRKSFGHAQSAISPASRARPRRHGARPFLPFRQCGPARTSATPSLAPPPTAL